MRAERLREEAVVREREAEEVRLAEGAFPALFSGGGGSAVARGAGAGAGAGGHRVLLVDSRMSRVMVESYSRPGLVESEEEAEGEDIASRVPPPSWEVEYVRVQRGPATRWVDLKGGGTAKYVAA
jgi:hypothetical protein